MLWPKNPERIVEPNGQEQCTEYELSLESSIGTCYEIETTHSDEKSSKELSTSFGFIDF